MSKVYVTQEASRKVGGDWVPVFDLTPATQFGELVILLPAGSSLFSPVPTIRSLREKLSSFSDEDYLLPVGDPVIMVAAACIAASVNAGRINVLKWDRHYRKYIPIQIDITGRAT